MGLSLTPETLNPRPKREGPNPKGPKDLIIMYLGVTDSSFVG